MRDRSGKDSCTRFQVPSETQNKDEKVHVYIFLPYFVKERSGKDCCTKLQVLSSVTYTTQLLPTTQRVKWSQAGGEEKKTSWKDRPIPPARKSEGTPRKITNIQLRRGPANTCPDQRNSRTWRPEFNGARFREGWSDSFFVFSYFVLTRDQSNLNFGVLREGLKIRVLFFCFVRDLPDVFVICFTWAQRNVPYVEF